MATVRVQPLTPLACLTHVLPACAVFEGEGFGQRGEARSDERHCVNSISVKYEKDARDLKEEAVTKKL